MPLEVIASLEKKIDALIETIQTVREEKKAADEKIGEQEKTIKRLEKEKQDLAAEVDMFKGDSQDNQNKLNTATEKIQGLIAKLEAVA